MAGAAWRPVPPPCQCPQPTATDRRTAHPATCSCGPTQAPVASTYRAARALPEFYSTMPSWSVSALAAVALVCALLAHAHPGKSYYGDPKTGCNPVEYGGRLTQDGCICAPPCTTVPKPGVPGACPPCDTCAGVHATGVTPQCAISRTGKNPPTNCGKHTQERSMPHCLTRSCVCTAT